MQTIAGLATSTSDFSVLVDVLQFLDDALDTGLVDTLSDDSADLTVFAPTNAAFARLAADLGYSGDPADASAVSDFLTDAVPATTLRDVVLYHVSPTTQLSTDLDDGGSIATLLSDATITRDGPTLVDNEPDLIDPSLVAVDNIATNGVVHVIDRVLLPIDLPGNDAPSVTGIVAASGTGFDTNGGDFDLLLAAVTTAGLDGVLNDPTLDLTVFAPTDDAFVGLSQQLGYSGSDEAGAWSYLVEALTLLGGGDPIPLLTEVLTYHVAGDSLQASQVLASTGIATLQGGTITVDGTTLRDADPEIGDPAIVATNIQASNGVVHVIDGVLLPADLLGSNGADDVDFIIAGDGADFLRTGADNDLIDGNGGSDRIFAGSGNDVILGGLGNDVLGAGSGNDTVLGEDGNDVIWGGAGRDSIDAGAGNDIIRGGAWSDVIEGGGGSDRIGAGTGNDTVDGGSGNDTLFGFSGHDELDGGAGNDVIFGGGHADVITGGAGTDILSGGRGADTFIFERGSQSDVILDFHSGVDRIDLRDFDFADFDDIEQAIDVTLLGTSIDLGNGDQLFLAGLFGVHVTEDDFIFYS